MKSIGAVDLSTAALLAVKLAEAVGQPPVVIGALAMAAHGYRRETSDVDIVLPLVVSSAEGERLIELAKEIGLTVRAKHSFGGLDLRHGDVRIDVLTLDQETDFPDLIADVVAEAVAAGRKTDLFGQQVYVASVGHLICLKLIAERKKDMVDIVELIKARIENGTYPFQMSHEVQNVVRSHLGAYGVRTMQRLESEAWAEMR